MLSVKQRLKLKSRAKPIFEKPAHGKPTLKSTLKRVACYRCGASGGTLVRHSIGYRHMDPSLCVRNIKARRTREKFLREYVRMLKRRRRIDYKIFMWLRRKRGTIWRFFRHRLAGSPLRAQGKQ